MTPPENPDTREIDLENSRNSGESRPNTTIYSSMWRAVTAVIHTPVLLGLFLIAGTGHAVVQMLQRGGSLGIRTAGLLVSAVLIQFFFWILAAKLAVAGQEEGTRNVRRLILDSVYAVPLLVGAAVAMFVFLSVGAAVGIAFATFLPRSLVIMAGVILVLVVAFHSLFIFPAVAIDGEDPMAAIGLSWFGMAGYRLDVAGIVLVLGIPSSLLTYVLRDSYGIKFGAIAGLNGILTGITILSLCFLYISTRDEPAA